MTPTDQPQPLADPERGYGARIFLVAMGLALAMTGGAILSAAGNGDLQQAVRIMGLVRGPDVEAEQRQQALAIARLEDNLRALTGEIQALRSHPVATRADSTIVDHLARIDADLALLNLETAAMRSAQGEPGVDEPWRREIDELRSGLTQAGIDVSALRSSFEGGEQARARQIADIGKRVDRLERLIAAADTTSSIAAAPTGRRSLRRLPGWSVQEAQYGAAIITGRTGSFEVKPGTVVPGIGRVTSVRARANRWIVVTDKGIIVQR